MAGCENTRKVSAYHDGELPPDAADELARHMPGCESCRRELERLRAMSRWLSSAPMAEVPAAVLARLRQAVRPRRDRIILRTTKVLTAAAAAVLLVCGVLLWERWSAPPAPAAPAPAQWERLAVAPVAAAVAELELQADAETEVDVQLARSLLAGAGSENGYEDE